MFKRPSAILALAFTFMSCGALSASAQDEPGGNALVDGITAGIGLTTFFGEIDNVIGVRPIQHIAQSRLHLLAGVDRDLPFGRVGLEVNYQNFDGLEDTFDEGQEIHVEGHLVSLDVIYSIGFDLIQEDYFRIYTGIGSSYVSPQYDVDGSFDWNGRVEAEALESGEETLDNENWSINLAGSRFLVTNPVGIMIDDRLRIGARITWTDYLDGIRFKDSPWDYLTNFTLGWRFDL